MVTTNCDCINYYCVSPHNAWVVKTSAQITETNCKLDRALTCNNWKCTDNQYIATPSVVMTGATSIDIATNSALYHGFSNQYLTIFIGFVLIVFLIFFWLGAWIYKR